MGRWACIRCRGGREGSYTSALPTLPCFHLPVLGPELGGRCWHRSDRRPVRAQAALATCQSLLQHLAQLKLLRKWPWWGGECACVPPHPVPGKHHLRGHPAGLACGGRLMTPEHWKGFRGHLSQAFPFTNGETEAQREEVNFSNSTRNYT